MAQKSERPARYLRSGGPQVIVQKLPGSDTLNTTLTVKERQAIVLARRFHLPATVATVLAALAFPPEREGAN